MKPYSVFWDFSLLCLLALTALVLFAAAGTMQGCATPTPTRAPRCKVVETVTELGQCAYNGGTQVSTCVAKTSNHNVARQEPYVTGESVCVEYDK